LPAGAVARLGTIRWRPDAVIRAVTFSPDGKTIYSNAEDSTVRGWDALTGIEQHRFVNLAQCWKVQLSSDGQLIAGLRSRQAVLVERRSGKTLLTIPVTDYIGGFALSPDGRILATGDTPALSGELNTITLYKTASGEILFSLPAHGGGVRAIVFAGDGKSLYSAGGDCRIRAWDCVKGVALPREDGAFQHRTAIWSLALSPDGKTLASGADAVFLWDIASGKQLRRLQGHAGEVY